MTIIWQILKCKKYYIFTQAYGVFIYCIMYVINSQ